MQKRKPSPACSGGLGPQDMSTTGGGGPARVPILRVRTHLFTADVAPQERRTKQGPAIVPSSWRGQVLPVRCKTEGRTRLSAKEQVSVRHVAKQARLVQTVNMQATGQQLTLDENVVSQCVDARVRRRTPRPWRCLPRSRAMNSGCGPSSKTAPGSLSSVSQADRTSTKDTVQLAARPS